MTYKDKFNASEHKAHYKNIATKVLREMTTLRASVETSPNTPRRWVWELLQNAKDVHSGEGVNIVVSEIEKDGKDYLIFQHDGLPFTADNIRFLIEQISSKDREKNEEGKRKETGKFGTGFLATHMLSETVKVVGIAKEEGLDYRKFSFVLDRSGYEPDEVIAAVEKSKSQIEDLDSLPPYLHYDESELNTAFIYLLGDQTSRQVKNQGIADLKINLPYALCFVEKISSVRLKPSDITFALDTEAVLDDFFEIEQKTIKVKTKGASEFLDFAILSRGLTSIAIPIEVVENSIKIISIDLAVPRLFCDFPLIGTETFPFPTVINNPNFNPTDPRDGIFLTDSSRPNPLTEENKRILEDSVKLFIELLDFAAMSGWQNLHLLAKIGNLHGTMLNNTSVNWYNSAIQIPLREKLGKSKIVRNALGHLCSIFNADGTKYIWFPSGGTKEIREKIWSLANMWFPHALPHKEDMEFWAHNIWPECGKLTLSQLSEFVETSKTIASLSDSLGINDKVKWLNSLYQVLNVDNSQYVTIMDAKAIVPDQNGALVKKGRLLQQVDHIPELFKDMLTLLGDDIRSKLVDEGISLEFDETNHYSMADAIRSITTEVLDKTADREIAQNFRPAFRLILKYFRDDPKSAKNYFPTIFSKKHLLYDDDEIMDNINKAEELQDLLTVFEVGSADELRKKFEHLASNKPSLLPITEKILVSMGITNVEEWEEAMRDTDLRALFEHRSIPTKEMFVLAHSHIKKARERVIAHLRTLPDYELNDIDTQTASTVIADVYKNGRPIRIVFRPAYSKEVIVYYDSEKDTMDYADMELWVDDGENVWNVSLGYILKKNNIKKFRI